MTTTSKLINMTPETVRQDLLALANKDAQLAKELLNEIKTLKERILKEFPINTFGYSKSQITKQTSFEKLQTHLKSIQYHPFSLESLYRREDELESQRLLEEQKKKNADEQQQAIQKYQEKAVIWLLAQGEKLGEDFTLDNAVDTAENKAFYQEVNRRQSKVMFIEFYGNENCDEECRGWDMTSERCDCENCRVEFERDCYFNFEDPKIHAEAY